MPNLHLIARMDCTGLGQGQTLQICKMLKPDKLMVINSTPFNGNKQHPEWYDGFNAYVVNGFPTTSDCNAFLNGATHVLTCETPYNYAMYRLAQARGIKLFNQCNYEFLDNLVDSRIGLPYKFIMPSQWMLEDMQRRFPDKVEYLPPPLFPNDFKKAREANLSRTGKRKFLHVVGKLATHDRNGTLSTIEALQYTDSDFELVIRAQSDLTPYMQYTNDKRITFDNTHIENNADLYKDFDAMLFPRRYGGLALPMNEALMSGLPVIMTDISPNNAILPKDWLVESWVKERFLARTAIDVYEADAVQLANKLDWLCNLSDDELTNNKVEAFYLALEYYSADELKPKYEGLLI